MGSRPLGKFALELLMKQDNIEIVGVCVLETYHDCYWESDPSDITEFRLLSLDDLYDLDFDIALSVNYWKVISATLLAKPRLGFYNIHHSYNLTYRGLNIATHAIIEARKRNQWYHGTTLHRMAERLDEGEIVASQSCGIAENETAFSLFKRVELLAEELIKTWFPRLLHQRIICAEPTKDYLYFSKADLPSKDLSSISTPLELFDLVRAFFFPPHELPYVLLNGRKRYLTIEKGQKRSLYLNAGRGRKVYVLDNN